MILASLFVTSALRLSAQEKSLGEANTAFARIDRKLNEAYQEAKRTLPDWRFLKIQEAQREWLDYRDQRAEAAAVFDGGADQGAEKENPEYWNALGYLTETRIEILEAWMKVDKFSQQWEGVWIDGYGGVLSVAEEENGDLRFTLQVVRGPTYHLGAVAGTAKTNDTTARFSTRAEGAERETWLTLLQEDGQIRVIGENTSWFHGARAYFDGHYIRVRELDDEDRKAIESPEF
jgi:uncharacterized protein YecT (DUF1311 family)